MTAATSTVLLALDVDGTLLDERGRLAADRASAVQGVAKRVRTILATGKTWPSIAALVERFDLEGPHIICNGAATVMETGEIEVLGALPPKISKTVMQELRRREIAFAVYRADGSIMADGPHDHFDRITELGEPAPDFGFVLSDGAGVGNGKGAEPLEVLKILAVLTEDQESDLRDLCSDQARIQRTGPHFLEWNNPTVSKGAALAHLSERHGWPLEEMVAVGDSENDMSMLMAAGTGVAVSTASPAAVDAADIHLSDDISVYLSVIGR